MVLVFAPQFLAGHYVLANDISVRIKELAPAGLPCQQQPDAIRGFAVPRAFPQTGLVGLAQILNINDFFIDDLLLVVPNHATTRLQADLDTSQCCRKVPRHLLLTTEGTMGRVARRVKPGVPALDPASATLVRSGQEPKPKPG